MAGEARKTVTVVFTDVTGSTSLGERLDPEALRAVMERYFETAQVVLERHGGTVEKFIGDAVMAVFGIPVVHEDDALRAVRAAVELRGEVRRLNEELDRERGVRIALRTGINTGEVMVGDPSARQFYATGDAVNVAARLEQAAGPDEILLGETTFRLVRDAVELDAVGDLELKGKTDSLPAWRLQGIDPEGVMVVRRLETPLVGRHDELEALIAAYERAREERSAQLCTVVGAPGLGKSRLAAELATRVEGEATVLNGRCLSYGEGITYWPLIEIVRQAGERFPLPDVVPERPLEVVAGLVGQEETTSSSEEAFWAVRKLFEALAAERSLVVVLDDVHWAEPTFLDLAEHVLEFSTDAPLLLVALARPEFLDARPLWASRRDDMSLVRLEPLAHEESEALLDALGTDVPQEARRRIEMAAAGNPLFLEQMLAMLAEDGHGNGDVPVPPTVQALLAARIDELPPDERAVVEPAAVVGQEFWREAVVALCPDVPVSASLQRLVRKDLIGKARSSFVDEDAFRFRHILIRDAAYAGIPKSRRADLHERFADWLEEATPEFEEIVGYHLEQAFHQLGELGPMGDRQRVLGRRASERLGAAGLRAWQRGDATASTSLLERALAVLPEGEPRPLRLVVALGVALETVGRLADAVTLLTAAAADAAAAGQRADEMRFRVESALIRFAHSESTEGLEALVEEALEVFTAAHDDAGLAAAWHLSSYPAWTGLRWQEMVVSMERALEHGRRAGDHARAERSANWLMMAYAWGPIPAEEGKARLEDLIRPFEPGGTLEASGLMFLGWFEAMAGDFERARALYREGIERISEGGAWLRRAGRTVIGGDIELFAGDPAAAEAELRTGVEIFERAGEKGILSTVAFNLAEAVYRQGRYDEAGKFARRSAELANPDDISSQTGSRRVLAKVLAQRGELEEAERLSVEAVALIDATDALFEQAITLVDRAEVLRLAGRKREAAEALDEAIRLYEAKGVVPGVAEARRLRAELTS
jgi:class 3 adenylate cyclase/tetratricopeptide (TPR) repeat protein